MTTFDKSIGKAPSEIAFNRILIISLAGWGSAPRVILSALSSVTCPP